MTAVPCRPVAGATIFSMLERPQVAGTGFPLGLPKTDFRRQLHRVGSQLPHAAWYSRYRPAAGVRCRTGTAAYVEGREIRPPGRSAPLMSPDVDLTAPVPWDMSAVGHPVASARVRPAPVLHRPRTSATGRKPSIPQGTRPAGPSIQGSHSRLSAALNLPKSAASVVPLRRESHLP